MGRVYLESDNFSDALSYFETARSEGLRDGLSESEAASLDISLAHCYLGLGRHDDARGHAEAALSASESLGDDTGAAEGHVVLARIEGKSGRFRRSLRSAETAYALLRTHPDSPLLAEASKVLGTAHAELGNSTAARDCFIDSLVTNRRLGNEEGVAGAYNNLGILSKRSGDLASAIDYFERALAIDERLGRPASVARRLNNLGLALYRMSKWDDAERHLRRAWEIYSRLGATRDVVALESALGNICRVRRDWSGARQHFTTALATSQQAGYLRAEALALEFLGDLSKDMGRFDDALGLLDQALAAASRLSSESDVVGEVLRRRAEVFLAVGRLNEAERDCSQALDLCRRIGDRLEEGATLRVLAGVSFARGDRSEGVVLIDRSEKILRRTGEAFELAMAAFTEGVGTLDAGPLDDPWLERIESRLGTAEELFERVGALHWVARSRLERANALHRAGVTARSRAWLGRARDAFEKAHDREGVARVDRLLAVLDAELCRSAGEDVDRYSLVAEASRALNSGGLTPERIHAFASSVAASSSSDRVLLFVLRGEEQPRVVMSVGRTGRRLAEVRRFVRAAVADGRVVRPVVAAAAATAGGAMPPPVAAVALLAAETGAADGETFLLYADRLKSSGGTAFSAGDIEFLGAAAHVLARMHSAGSPDSSDERDDASTSSQFITRDPNMLGVIESLEKLGDSSIPVLILGESGVGKDVLARSIHAAGARGGKFVALNSGAVPHHLQESELFGHVKGAFTDADRDREGLVESAHGGTLFLDEIGEMSKELQVKLLRFLQSGEYRRVGESVVRRSDARILSASNRDLREEVAEGRFRRDLYYRLGAFVVEVPPLRDRRCDIPLLVEHFLELYSELEGKEVDGLTDEAAELVRCYDWSGNNVRELENEVRRGVALCPPGGSIGLDHLRPELVAMRAELVRGCAGGTCGASLKDEVEALERDRIHEALEKTGDSKQDAADYLGLSRTGLYTKMKKYGMS